IMAYIAGLIDGDGSISLCRKQEKGAKSPFYFPLIQFSKSSKILTNLLKEEFKGSVCHGVLKSGLPFFRWKIEKSTLCKPFLEEVVPFLQGKKEQGEILLSFIEENPFKRGIQLTCDDLIKREDYYMKMKNL